MGAVAQSQEIEEPEELGEEGEGGEYATLVVCSDQGLRGGSKDGLGARSEGLVLVDLRSSWDCVSSKDTVRLRPEYSEPAYSGCEC